MFKLLVLMFSLGSRRQSVAKLLVVGTFFAHFAAFLAFRGTTRN
ncbi:MAG: hypothetical protein AB7W16_24530 [Candidatus Obscuribacterales bacterium]